MAIADKLPLHTRLGTYATAILIALLSFFLLRNCVSAVYYGVTVNENELTSFYELGFDAGSKETDMMTEGLENEITNPFLLKVYQKGFREGRDSIRSTLKREKNEKN